MPHSTRLPKYRRDPDRFGRIEPTSRDMEILRLVHERRFLTADMIAALVPGSRRQIARRLQGLFHHSFLARLLPPMRVRLGHDDHPIGSPKVAYALDAQGATALSAAFGVPLDALNWKPRNNQRMHWFLEHRLMISAFRATLELSLKATTRSLSYRGWTDEENLRDSVRVRYADGRIKEHRVAPDGYFAVQDGSNHRNFFVEIDRSTEDHPRLLAKFQSLWWYLSDGSAYFEKYQNPTNRLVLVVTMTERRLEAMRRTLRRVDPKGRGLRQFWFTTQSAYRLSSPGSLLDPIWRVGPTPRDHAEDPPRSLFQNTEALR